MFPIKRKSKLLLFPIRPKIQFLPENIIKIVISLCIIGQASCLLDETKNEMPLTISGVPLINNGQKKIFGWVGKLARDICKNIITVGDVYKDNP